MVRSGKLTAEKATINLTAKEGLDKDTVGDSLVVLTAGSQLVVDNKAGYPGEVPSIVLNNTGYTPKNPDGKDF